MPMRHDPDGRVVEVGARTRTTPPALRRALHHRDRGCRFPGCRLRFAEGHHVAGTIARCTKKATGSVSNPTASCDSTGRTAGLYPRSRRRYVVELVTARTDADGVRVHARTMTAGWFGDRLDVGYAIDVMHPLAR